MTFKDKTFCARKGCTNNCKRKMTEKELAELKALPRELQSVSYSYYCESEAELKVSSGESSASVADNTSIAAAKIDTNIIIPPNTIIH